MDAENTRTLLDYWPILALLVLAIVAIVAVARGLKRPADASKNKSSGGGAHYVGRGGRW